MALSKAYYDSLVGTLKANSAAKKAAYDAALMRATTATWDAAGNVTGYKKYDDKGNLVSETGGAPGELDVTYENRKRGIQVGGEASGTLRSGQQFRSLAEAMADYKRGVGIAQGGATAGKTAVDTEQAQKLAEYAAMYKPEKTTPRSNRSNGRGRTGNTTVGQNKNTVTEPPKFIPGVNAGAGPMGPLAPASTGPLGPQGGPLSGRDRRW